MSDVVKRRAALNGKADDEDVGLWVGEWAQAIVVLLASRVPEVHSDKLSMNWHVLGVVIKPGKREGGTLDVALTDVVSNPVRLGTSGVLEATDWGITMTATRNYYAVAYIFFHLENNAIFTMRRRVHSLLSP